MLSSLILSPMQYAVNSSSKFEKITLLNKFGVYFIVPGQTPCIDPDKQMEDVLEINQDFMHINSKEHLEPSRTSMMELYCKNC